MYIINQDMSRSCPEPHRDTPDTQTLFIIGMFFLAQDTNRQKHIEAMEDIMILSLIIDCPMSMLN